MKPVVIGISGVTNGGKTTLCDKLCEVYPGCKVLCMDDFYWGDENPHHIRLEQFNGYANWEVESSVDFVRLVNEVRSWRAGAGAGQVLLVEGIIIFNNAELAAECDLKFFLSLPRDECQRRRKARDYDPPEPDGYFDAICWPEYINNKQALKPQADIRYLDGEQPQSETFTFVHEQIQQLLTQNS